MPAKSQQQFKFMQGVAHGSIKKKGLSEKEAEDFVSSQSPKGLPKKVGTGQDVGYGSSKSKKAAPKSKKAAPKMAPKMPPMNPSATGMAQIPYGQQVVPRPAGMSSLGIGSSNVSKTGHVRQPNPMLAARRPNRVKMPGMNLGVGSDAAEDRKMSAKELKADIKEDKTILKEKVGTGSDLTSRRRNSLPKSDFGMPGERKYPMPDRSHAANAKARASQQEAKGNLSASAKAKIDAKADKVLGKK